MVEYLITQTSARGVSQISKMESFTTVLNGFYPLIIVAKPSISDVARALVPPMDTVLLEPHFKRIAPDISQGYPKS